MLYYYGYENKYHSLVIDPVHNSDNNRGYYYYRNYIPLPKDIEKYSCTVDDGVLFNGNCVPVIR